MLKGIEDGMSAKEVQEKFGLSPEKYDAARKRMERTIAKRYPNGMNS